MLRLNKFSIQAATTEAAKAVARLVEELDSDFMILWNDELPTVWRVRELIHIRGGPGTEAFRTALAGKVRFEVHEQVGII